MATTKETSIYIPEISQVTLRVAILGTSPLICCRMSEKARHELLAPAGRKNTAERQASVKHDPLAEFRASPYTLTDEASPTYLAFMSSAFKGAMATAALDLPGTKKAQIGRLVYVQGDYTPVYGLPRLFMTVVRSADINRTPDIRSRAILSRWACWLEVTFVGTLLKPQSIVNLLSAAGVTVGVGDWRPEKGKGNYGQFRVVRDDDPLFVEVVAEGGRVAQQEAMVVAEPYDLESAEMVSYWQGTMEKRGR